MAVQGLVTNLQPSIGISPGVVVVVVSSFMPPQEVVVKEKTQNLSNQRFIRHRYFSSSMSCSISLTTLPTSSHRSSVSSMIYCSATTVSVVFSRSILDIRTTLLIMSASSGFYVSS